MCDAFICSEKEEFYRRYAYTAFMVTTVPIGNRLCINYTENNNMMHRFLPKKILVECWKTFQTTEETESCGPHPSPLISLLQACPFRHMLHP